MTSKTNIALHATEESLSAWLGMAAPGEVFAYHRGFLAIDAAPGPGRMPEAARAELARVAGRAAAAAANGLVFLIQRRHGPGDYSYLLIARRRPRRVGRPPAIAPPVEAATRSRHAAGIPFTISSEASP